MPRDPREYRIISTESLAEHETGIDMCHWCKNPVYDRARYGRDRELREQAKRGWIVFADTMHWIAGPDGERPVCGACGAQGQGLVGPAGFQGLVAAAPHRADQG